MRLRIMMMTVLLSALIGCASTEKRKVPTDLQSMADERYDVLLKDFEDPTNKIPYEHMFSAFLESSHALNTGAVYDDYLATLSQVEADQISCQDVNWDQLTHRNFFSIKPHLSAKECFAQTGNVTREAYHDRALNYVISGILSSGDGEQFYSAYEVTSLGDAGDILELSGHEIIDSYLTSDRDGQGLYQVYIVNNEDSEKQESIHFQSERFIHRVLGSKYPFRPIVDVRYEAVLKDLSETDLSAQIGLGLIYKSKGLYQKAANAFSDAKQNGSIIASFHLGGLCFIKNQDVMKDEDCIEHLFDSAELGYVTANILIAHAYQQGMGVEKNAELADQLLKGTESRLAEGELWSILASFYGSNLRYENDVSKDLYLNKAAQAGLDSAKFYVISSELKKNKGVATEGQLQKLLALAQSGYAEAQLKYVYESYKALKGKPIPHDLVEWIEKAIAQGLPAADYWMGSLYEFDFFGKKDYVKAFTYFERAAQKHNLKAQIRMGQYLDKGVGHQRNSQIANLWFSLCAQRSNGECLYYLGKNFFNGRGTSQSYIHARETLELADKAGVTAGNHLLAWIYLNGKGVKPNTDKAIALYNASCQQGNGPSCSELGKLYQENQAYKDTAKALNFYKSACKSNDKAGCRKVAEAFQKGIGVGQNLFLSSEIYLNLCTQLDVMGCQSLTQLAERNYDVKKHIEATGWSFDEKIKRQKVENKIGCGISENIGDCVEKTMSSKGFVL